MSSKIKDDSIITLRLVQIPEPEFSKEIARYIVDNPLPVYPGSYVKAVNLKTGVQKDTIRQISRSIHKPECVWWIYSMVTLMIVKFAIGEPDGSWDAACLLQSHYQNFMIPREAEALDEELSELMMPSLKFGSKPYSSYPDIWKKRLNLVVWSAVEYNVARYVKSNKIGYI